MRREVVSEVQILPLSAIRPIRQAAASFYSQDTVCHTAMEIDGKQISIDGAIPGIARLDQEWFEDVEKPDMLVDALRKTKPAPDIFTFWQRLPELQPKYAYRMEAEAIAALPITSYSHWWEKQIDGAARNKVRKAQKKGVEVRLANFDDRFIEGMTSIFNETPIRQGRNFLHYGKDFETVKRQFSRFLFREEIFGAYLGEGLVGFIMLANAGDMQSLVKLFQRSRVGIWRPRMPCWPRPLNAARRRESHTSRMHIGSTTVSANSKRNNGFQKFDLPRYFLPLTRKGKLALHLGLHRGWKA